MSSPLSSNERSPDPSVALAMLKGIVRHWNEFGAVDGLQELMHYAHEYLEGRGPQHETVVAHSPEPSAYLKLWTAPDGPKCRVDLTQVCEPWLDRLRPVITPLYARMPGAAVETTCSDSAPSAAGQRAAEPSSTKEGSEPATVGAESPTEKCESREIDRLARLRCECPYSEAITGQHRAECPANTITCIHCGAETSWSDVPCESCGKSPVKATGDADGR